jgi:hypothetical protein
VLDHDPSSAPAWARNVKSDDAAMVSVGVDVDVARFDVAQLLNLCSSWEEIGDPDQEAFQTMGNTTQGAHVLLVGDKMGTSGAPDGFPLSPPMYQMKQPFGLISSFMGALAPFWPAIAFLAIALACNRDGNVTSGMEDTLGVHFVSASPSSVFSASSLRSSSILILTRCR